MKYEEDCGYGSKDQTPEERQATFKQLGLKKKIARKFDYFSNEDKRVMNLFDYYTGELNKNERMNLVIEDGSYATKEEIEKKTLCKVC